MYSVFLSRDEVKELTGFTQKRKQINWLRDNNINHKVNAIGYAVVLRKEVEFNNCLNDEAEPNFGALYG